MSDINSLIKGEILKKLKDKKLPCAVAFNIAANNNTEAFVIGRAADELDIKLSKCQLGLFGYQPNAKPIQPAKDINQNNRDKILKYVKEGRISCKNLWKAAKEADITKMKAANTCEALNIKIVSCQLEAF
ncbi:MAG: hypothetical protein JRJ49_06395 [Deltaproteobacteria bacterium]|nr:hypothetical protein [Deltaproteobacteria bacterium]